MLQSATLKKLASEEGFAACGVAKAERVSPQREKEMREWLERGEHGEMDYLVRHVEMKLDPRLLVEGAQSVVSVAVNYNPGEEAEQSQWKLAKYALGTDYHEVVKSLLRRLMQRLGLTEGVDGRCFVDTAPVDEKYWAQQCGLGWRGRNSQLILPKMGSYFFLGELLLTHPFDHYDAPHPNRCGHCRACLDACPMHALHGDGTLDARRCLSYLTIEHRGDVPAEAQKQMGHCFYGCDRCADACPWNRRFAQRTAVAELQPRSSILAMKPNDWLNLSVEQYQQLFRKSAVKRAKYDGLMRNIHCLETDEPTKGDAQPEPNADS